MWHAWSCPVYRAFVFRCRSCHLHTVIPDILSLCSIWFLLPCHHSPAVAVLLKFLLLLPPSSSVLFAMLPLAMLLLQCNFGEWLPTAAFLHLLAACHVDTSVLTTLRLVRSLSFSFNSLVDASAPALLSGVFCLGLQGRVPGIVMVERSVPLAFFDDVCHRLAYKCAC